MLPLWSAAVTVSRWSLPSAAGSLAVRADLEASHWKSSTRPSSVRVREAAAKLWSTLSLTVAVTAVPETLRVTVGAVSSTKSSLAVVIWSSHRVPEETPLPP